MSDYQRGLDCIRLLVNDDILPSGWRQLIRGVTRTEVREDRIIEAQLDHLYINEVDKAVKIFNENVTSTDHNMVGIRLKTVDKIFRQETFQCRSLKRITPEQFNEVWEAENQRTSTLKRTQVKP